MNVRNTINARQSRKISEGMESYKHQASASSRVLLGEPPQGTPGSRNRGGGSVGGSGGVIPGSSTKNPKISISDAIGLITLRIGRLEELAVNKSKQVNTPVDTSSEDTNTLIKSLIARITAIEDPSTVRDHIPEHESPTTGECSCAHTCNELVEDVANLKSDVEDLRKLIIKLQASI